MAGVPVLLPSGNWENFVPDGLVGDDCFEHGEDDVAAALGDADGGYVVFFAFVSVSLVVALVFRSRARVIRM